MTNNTTTDGATAFQFDDLLTLEDQYYQEGLELGIADGQKAGRIEGRLFGIEKGFEKFAEMGEMNGRASFLLQQSHPSLSTSSSSAAQDTKSSNTSLEADGKLKDLLERLAAQAATNSRVRVEFLRDAGYGERLNKQIISLFDLTDPATLSSLNTEEATEDFDERRKRAKAKLIMVEKALDAKSFSTSTGSIMSRSTASPLQVSSASAASSSAAVGVRLARNEGMNIEKNIEDFGS